VVRENAKPTAPISYPSIDASASVLDAIIGDRALHASQRAFLDRISAPTARSIWAPAPTS